MLGWEFPPYISGGLGTACYGLTRAMDNMGIKVTFVLPKGGITHRIGSVKMLGTEEFYEAAIPGQFTNVKFSIIASSLRPYVSFGSYRYGAANRGAVSVINSSQMSVTDNYGEDIFSAVSNYAEKTALAASTEHFDVVHAHDWMTYPAGQAVSWQNHKPLIVHVHSTEFDRSGEHVNQAVYDIERAGMHAAARVIAISNFTKNMILKHYGVSSEKVEVVHNAVEHNGNGHPQALLDKKDKIVLFLGRITMQKGPEYFLAAAKKVLQVVDNVKFVMAGSGDMMKRIVEMAAQMGIGSKVLFTGFLNGQDVDRAYQMADLYVILSVSEPFGIASLEAMNRNVPVLMSKQSGLAEVVTHALKVDFWDIDEMANKMIAVLKRPPLKETLGKNGFNEAHKFNWEDSAMKVKKIYEEVIAQSKGKER